MNEREAKLSPTAPDEREALIEVIYQTPTPVGRFSQSSWPFPATVTELAAAILAAGFRRSREATTEPQPITDTDVEAAGRAIAAEQGVRYPGSMQSTWDRLARAALEAVEASRSPKPTEPSTP